MKWSSTDKDDSYGETLDFCASVHVNWTAVYDNGAEDISHGAMLKWFIKQLEGHTITDFMEDNLYDFLLKHFKDENELVLKRTMLEKVMESSDTSKYHIPVLQDRYIRILADLKTPIDEIRAFAKKAGGCGIMEILATIELEYGNYDAAIAIYEQQIAERPGRHWSNGPRRALIDIYKKTGNKEKEFEQLKNLLWANVGDRKIFLEYKRHFSEDEWPGEWDKILEELKKHRGGAEWCAIERRFDIIMDKIEEPPVSDELIDIYEELEKLYPERCFKVRVERVKSLAKICCKRSDYRWLASKLQEICKYDGGEETASKLAAEFVAMYPKRSAMIDELSPFL